MNSNVPKYLYKVIKIKYFRDAVVYGRLLFNTLGSIKNCVGENADRSEFDGEIKVVFPDGSVRTYRGDYLIYCFTYDIESYLSKYPLGSDSVVLKFNTDIVLNFMESLGVTSCWYSHINYSERSDTELNCMIFDEYMYKAAISKWSIETLECVEKSFRKDEIFKDECEYRFLFKCPVIGGTLYYSHDLGYCLPSIDMRQSKKWHEEACKNALAMLNYNVFNCEKLRDYEAHCVNDCICTFFRGAEIIRNKDFVPMDCIELMVQ